MPVGDDHGPTLAGDVGEERQVRDLAGRHLVNGDVELVEEIGAGVVERRRHEEDTAASAVGDELAMRVGRQLELLEHVELRFAGVGVAGLIVRLDGVLGDELVGLERLELDGVGPRLGGGVDEPGARGPCRRRD